MHLSNRLQHSVGNFTLTVRLRTLTQDVALPANLKPSFDRIMASMMREMYVCVLPALAARYGHCPSDDFLRDRRYRLIDITALGLKAEITVNFTPKVHSFDYALVPQLLHEHVATNVYADVSQALQSKPDTIDIIDIMAIPLGDYIIDGGRPLGTSLFDDMLDEPSLSLFDRLLGSRRAVDRSPHRGDSLSGFMLGDPLFVDIGGMGAFLR